MFGQPRHCTLMVSLEAEGVRSGSQLDRRRGYIRFNPGNRHQWSSDQFPFVSITDSSRTSCHVCFVPKCDLTGMVAFGGKRTVACEPTRWPFKVGKHASAQNKTLNSGIERIPEPVQLM
jgi:hypothetical protein